MNLTEGSTVAVIGGGPAGSFFSYFLLEIAARIDLRIQLDIYEFKDFSRIGPAGCNHCGGIISESLVHLLAAEGINLPPSVVRHGIDSYLLHTDVGTVRIETPNLEKRIAAVYRGGGPLEATVEGWESFDAYLLNLAKAKGANVINRKVERIRLNNGRPQIEARETESKTYDLVVGAVGVNNGAIRMFEEMGIGFQGPDVTRTYICEFFLGEEVAREYLGNSMHVFLPSIPRLEFAAIIPKGGYATLCILGKGIDESLVNQFLNTPEVRECFPSERHLSHTACKCLPRINLRAVSKTFNDRVVLIGDSSVTRLFKDGIGAAYRTAKACAVTALFDGISAKNFENHYWPICKSLTMDNNIGKVIFSIVTFARRFRFFRKGILKMAEKEQRQQNRCKEMSIVLWDTFTGSASYQEIFVRAMRPSFLFRLGKQTLAELFSRNQSGVQS